LHYQRFDNIPWATIYRKGAWVVVPHVVLDEIDRKSYEEGGKIRTRARGVYRLLETLMSQADSEGYIKLTDGTRCLILADEPGRRRLPNNDDEIVAQAGFLQAVVPGQVTMLTRDIGMRARATAQQLHTESLPEKYLIPGDGLTSKELDKDLMSLEPGPADPEVEVTQ
jgi:predicted ribonuclease YlaK